MNYLAHAFLSFNDAEVLAGNLISDFVKGRSRYQFPAGIQKGIQLHRDIDRFTDEHDAVRAAREHFRPAYRLYAGAFTDVAFDHFLAVHLQATLNLKALTAQYYRQLDELVHHFPPVFAQMYPHMKTHDWLYNYQHIPAVERSFGGLMRRAAYITETDSAVAVLQEKYAVLQTHFASFWPELESFAKSRFGEIVY